MTTVPSFDKLPLHCKVPFRCTDIRGAGAEIAGEPGVAVGVDASETAGGSAAGLVLVVITAGVDVDTGAGGSERVVVTADELGVDEGAGVRTVDVTGEADDGAVGWNVPVADIAAEAC